MSAGNYDERALLDDGREGVAITIREATQDLLTRWSRLQHGRGIEWNPIRRDAPGRVTIAVPPETAERLRAIDPDPDEAVRKTIGVPRSIAGVMARERLDMTSISMTPHPASGIGSNGLVEALVDREIRDAGIAAPLDRKISLGDNGLLEAVRREAEQRHVLDRYPARDAGATSIIGTGELERAQEAVFEGMPLYGEVGAEIAKKLQGLDPKARKVVLHRLMVQNKRERREAEAREKAKRDRVQRCYDHLTELLQVGEAIMRWSSCPHLQRAERSQFDDLRRACRIGEARLFANVPKPDDTDVPPFPPEYERDVYRHAQVFVAQHDWAAAFKNATEMANAQINLSYEVCAFEFQVNGHRIVATATDLGESIVFGLAVRTGRGWFVSPEVFDLDGAAVTGANAANAAVWPFAPPLTRMIGAQVRAIAISLDAEVATTEVRREPHAGHARGRPNMPLPSYAYHVVCLARRARADRLPASDDGSERRRTRLHFRRGHWRHYATWKTWIKWMLCGDPDLGFVDKMYRL